MGKGLVNDLEALNALGNKSCIPDAVGGNLHESSIAYGFRGFLVKNNPVISAQL